MNDTEARIVLDALADAVIVAGRDERICYANTAAEALFGWSAAELVGRPLASIMPERMRAAHHEGFARYVGTRKGRLFGRPVRVCALRSDGTELDVELTLASPGATLDHDVVVASLRDLRGRVDTERQLSITRRAYIEAKEAVRIRDEFLSIASHELRTPLTSMTLAVQGLARLARAAPTLPSDVVIAKLAPAERQGHRLAKLVTDLLDISRIAVGKIALAPESVDLAELVRDVCARSADEIGDAGCELRVHADGPMIGCWDGSRLDQVITNLVSNAAKFGQRRPIDVTLDRADDRARLSVRDHGIGIAAGDQERIFRRFERAVSSKNYAGFGLGLWIVREIVEAHGGAIRVESTPGDGAAFVVDLPWSAAGRRAA